MTQTRTSKWGVQGFLAAAHAPRADALRMRERWRVLLWRGCGLAGVHNSMCVLQGSAYMLFNNCSTCWLWLGCRVLGTCATARVAGRWCTWRPRWGAPLHWASCSRTGHLLQVGVPCLPRHKCVHKRGPGLCSVIDTRMKRRLQASRLWCFP